MTDKCIRSSLVKTEKNPIFLPVFVILVLKLIKKYDIITDV